MQEKIQLNYHFLDWITSYVKDMIESTIEDNSEKLETFISVNNMLNGINNLSTPAISKYVSEDLTDKILEEVRNNI